MKVLQLGKDSLALVTMAQPKSKQVLDHGQKCLPCVSVWTALGGVHVSMSV